MTPEFDLQGPKKTRWWEHALRFAFGGVVTVVVGLIAQRWGPVIGGLFLGFPSIFPAAITLVKEHDGRAKAIDDARGARLGSIALIAFAMVVWATTPTWRPAVVLSTAAITWLVVAVGVWAMVYGPRAA